MKHYRKTGRGLLGLIDRIKKPIGGVLAVAFIITTYSLASADDYQEAKRRAEPATVTQAEEPAAPEVPKEPERTYYAVPLTEDLQDVIIDTASGRGVDPALVLAVIEKESGYNPDAAGDNGRSQGLMQIWRSFHEKRMEKLGAVNLYDPKDNVLVGIDILAEKLDKYEDAEKALIAYNAGDAGAKKHYFSKGVYSNGYSRAVLKIAEESRTK